MLIHWDHTATQLCLWYHWQQAHAVHPGNKSSSLNTHWCLDSYCKNSRNYSFKRIEERKGWKNKWMLIQLCLWKRNSFSYFKTYLSRVQTESLEQQRAYSYVGRGTLRKTIKTLTLSDNLAFEEDYPLLKVAIPEPHKGRQPDVSRGLVW